MQPSVAIHPNGTPPNSYRKANYEKDKEAKRKIVFDNRV